MLDVSAGWEALPPDVCLHILRFIVYADRLHRYDGIPRTSAPEDRRGRWRYWCAQRDESTISLVSLQKLARVSTGFRSYVRKVAAEVWPAIERNLRRSILELKSVQGELHSLISEAQDTEEDILDSYDTFDPAADSLIETVLMVRLLLNKHAIPVAQILGEGHPARLYILLMAHILDQINNPWEMAYSAQLKCARRFEFEYSNVQSRILHGLHDQVEFVGFLNGIKSDQAIFAQAKRLKLPFKYVEPTRVAAVNEYIGHVRSSHERLWATKSVEKPEVTQQLIIGYLGRHLNLLYATSLWTRPQSSNLSLQEGYVCQHNGILHLAYASSVVNMM